MSEKTKFLLLLKMTRASIHDKTLLFTDELEKLEKQLESEEAKSRRLEEDHNRSQQERQHLSATEVEMRRLEKIKSNRIDELERQLQTKDDLVSDISSFSINPWATVRSFAW